MKRSLNVCFVVITALCLTACGGIGEEDLVGNWNGAVTVSDADREKANENATPEQRQLIESMLANLSPTLELREDLTFSMTTAGVPTEGTWVLEDMKVTLTTTKVMGMDVNEALKLAGREGADDNRTTVFSVGDDGAKLTGSDPTGQSTSIITFTRP